MESDQAFQFENLIVGPANQLAVAAACAVAESPSPANNPFVIHAASGLGKTHTLLAIGILARQLRPRAVIEYVAFDDFVQQLALITTDTRAAWVARWRRTELLLVDDVPLASDAHAAVDELLSIVSEARAQARQVAVTTDRDPATATEADPTIVEALTAGLVVGISPPERETRISLLRALAGSNRPDLTDKHLAELASIELANVRELRGALNQFEALRSQRGFDPRAAEVARPFGATLAPGARQSHLDFQRYLNSLGSAEPASTDAWMTRMSDVISHWASEGYRTVVLERALSEGKAADAEKLADDFARVVARLKQLESDAINVDPGYASYRALHDPSRLERAEELVRRVRAGTEPPGGPARQYAPVLFEVSTSNEFAARAADDVVLRPGTRFNPLLIHGPRGVGKTHLAHAIAHRIAARAGGAQAVGCVSAKRFVDELSAAMEGGAIEQWRVRFTTPDTLIIDDVHRVVSHARAQQELIALHDALVEQGKQLVLTSAEPPRRIAGLDPRMLSRIDAGLCAALGAPDRSLRMRLAARVLQEQGHSADAELIDALADRSVENMRELAALVLRIVAVARDRAVAPSAALVHSELGRASLETRGRMSMRIANVAFLDPEKIVWDWPDPMSQLIEELR